MTGPRMLSLDDRAEIGDLYLRYSFAYDDGEAELCAGLFIEDGRFTNAGAAPLLGRPALADMVRASAARAGGGRHLLSGVLVEARADGASGTAYVQVVRVEEAALRLVALGRYADEFAHTADGWKFTSRQFTPFTGPQLGGAVLAAPSSP
jgi:SnoaL-like domain